MNHLSFKSATIASILLFSLSAYAQERPRDFDYRNNERFYRGRLFERVRSDLDRIEDRTFPFTGDRNRLSRTKLELDELQSKLDAGRFDDRELDEVIGAMQAVVNENRLRPRDRDALSDDLARMSEFRESRMRWMQETQGPPPRGDGDSYNERDFYRNNERFYRGRLFERVRSDLDRIEDRTFPFTGDRSRLSQTKLELNELQNKLDAGRFDDRELDEVIGAMQAVVNENRLRPADRDALSDDLARLREFRERRERR